MPKYTFCRDIVECATCEVEASSPEEAIQRFEDSNQWKENGGALIWRSLDSGDKETKLGLGDCVNDTFFDEDGTEFDIASVRDGTPTPLYRFHVTQYKTLTYSTTVMAPTREEAKIMGKNLNWDVFEPESSEFDPEIFVEKGSTS